MTTPLSTAISLNTTRRQAGRGTVRHRVAALLLVALTGAAVSVVHAQPAGPAGAALGMALGGMQASAHHGMGHGMAGSGMMGERMLDAAGASAEQKAKVRDLLKSAQDDRRKQHEGDLELHQKMVTLMAAPQVDAVAAEALRQQLQARRDVASKRQLQVMLDVSAVLTPEQRAAAVQRMERRGAAMRERMERGQPGSRRP